MPYIYQADLWCDDCGADLCRELPTPEGYDPQNESSWDSDDYPKYADPEATDTPQHCANGIECGDIIGDELTDEGHEYVREAWRENPDSPVVAEWITHFGVEFEPLDILRAWAEGKGDDCPDPDTPAGQNETGKDLAELLAEYDDPEDSIAEIADALVPTYNAARRRWLADDPNADRYIEDATGNLGTPEPFDLNTLLGWAMAEQYCAALYDVWEAAVEAARDM